MISRCTAEAVSVVKHVAPYLYVGIGGFAGSLLRYAVTLASRGHSLSFPVGTLLSNLGGCLAIGVFVTLAARATSVPTEVRLLVATGICGGFTTMSSFVYELMQFVRDGEMAAAAGYFAATVLGSCVCFALGAMIVRLVAKG
ncbi:MAG: fluoride efflux transporter CrcB [Chitinivibrionales bacterium]|nr:fluoride efflux transporter CrcB [Chitinivibrionales bacterium]